MWWVHTYGSPGSSASPSMSLQEWTLHLMKLCLFCRELGSWNSRGGWKSRSPEVI